MIRLVLAAIVLLGSAVSSWADVIDFEIGSLFLNPGQTGSLEGFNFTNSAGASAFIVVPVTADSCSPLCVSNGTKTMGLFNEIGRAHV